MDTVQQDWTREGWTQQTWTQQTWVNRAPAPQSQQRQYPRLAAALGVERRTLADVFEQVQHNLSKLRNLTLAELKLLVNVSDAERIFYLVQWERLQGHLELYGTLPEEDLWPLLETLAPIFERHFNPSFYHRSRLNDTLIALYRAEFFGLDGDVCLNLTPPSPTQRVLAWLGF